MIVGKCEERKSNFKDFFYIYYFNLKGQCLRGPAGQSLPGKLKITPRPDGKRVIQITLSPEQGIFYLISSR